MNELRTVQLVISDVLQCSLSVRRTPQYLRFVSRVNPHGRCQRTRLKWDALDQLHDAPAPDEEVYAAVCVGKSSAHIDMVKEGRRVGLWEQTYHYELLPQQPASEVLRDNAKWAEWAQSQPGVTHDGAGTAGD